jgi:hypothetical protein
MNTILKQPARAVSAALTGLLSLAYPSDGAGAACASAARIESGATESIAPEERLNRNEVTAYAGGGDSAFRKDQEKGLQGDKDAAFRVAQMYRTASNGVPRDERRMVQWLLHASSLKNGAASYQLYRHYLDLRLDRDAVFFENRAIEQGFTPPARLDPRRG